MGLNTIRNKTPEAAKEKCPESNVFEFHLNYPAYPCKV